MPAARRSPLLSFSQSELNSRANEPSDLGDESRSLSNRRWYYNLPLAGTLLLILGPQPSMFYVLFDFFLRLKHHPFVFAAHLFVLCTLVFMVLSSLLVCIARDPGLPNVPSRLEGADGTGEEMGLSEALIADDDFLVPGRWCRKCWAPKPERAHHCSLCGRCVLKMDHHCPWLGNRCVGHRTYPAFIHFLCSITVLSIYIAATSIHTLLYSFSHVYEVNEMTPVHELALAFLGVLFTLVIGSFACYHFYLISTNQTTLENVSPFLLLRHLPPLPPRGHSLSDPPLEPELSYAQRRMVKDAHGQILLYDTGLRKNWAHALGWKTPYGWLYRLWCGGASSLGDGKIFPKNPKTDEMLSKLAHELVKLDADR